MKIHCPTCSNPIRDQIFTGFSPRLILNSLNGADQRIHLSRGALCCDHPNALYHAFQRLRHDDDLDLGEDFEDVFVVDLDDQVHEPDVVDFFTGLLKVIVGCFHASMINFSIIVNELIYV